MCELHDWFVLLEYVQMWVISTREACCWLLGCCGGAVDGINFVKHSLDSAKDTHGRSLNTMYTCCEKANLLALVCDVYL